MIKVPVQINALIWLFVVAAVLKLIAAISGIYGYSSDFVSDESHVLRLSSAERLWSGFLGCFWLLAAYGLKRRELIAWRSLYWLAFAVASLVLVRGVLVISQSGIGIAVSLVQTLFGVVACFLFIRWWRDKRGFFQGESS